VDEIKSRENRRRLIQYAPERVPGVIASLVAKNLISREALFDDVLRGDFGDEVEDVLCEELEGDESRHAVREMVSSINEDALEIEGDEGEGDYTVFGQTPIHPLARLTDFCL
jgi:hypothetical protein